MEKIRTNVVRLDAMNPKKFVCLGVTQFLLLTGALLLSMMGPDMIQELPPSRGSGTNIRLADNVSQTYPRNVCHRNAYGDDYNETIKRCWSHTFTFHNQFSNYMKLEMAVNRKAAELSRDQFSQKLKLDVEWYGEKRGELDGDDQWRSIPELIASDKIERTVTCNEPFQRCDKDVIVQASHIYYDAFWVQISIADEDYETAASFIETVDIFFLYETSNFAKLEETYKYFFVATSVIATILWWVTCSNAKPSVNNEVLSADSSFCFCGCPFVTFEQKWVFALLLSLVWYNYPLYALEYSESTSTRSFAGVLGVICEFTFICALFYFWMQVLASLVQDPPYTYKNFYGPKLFFACVTWLFGVWSYSVYVMRKIEDPLYDWNNETHAMNLLPIFGIAYFIWMVYYLIRAYEELKDLKTSGKYVYYSLFFRILCTIVGFWVGSLWQVQVDHMADLLFFHALFNFYVYELMYLYSPTKGSKEHAERVFDLESVEFDGHNVVPAPTSNGPQKPSASADDVEMTAISL